MKTRQKIPVILLVVLLVLLVTLLILKQKYYESFADLELKHLPFHTPATKTPSFESSIPRKVFMTWTTNDIPPKMHDVVTTNIKNNPEFDFYLYDESACRKFIAEHFDAETVAAFDGLKPKSYKSDLWRYCVIYINGGIYTDIKFIYNTPLLDILKYNTTVFCQDLMDDAIITGYLVAKPRDDVFLQCINKIKENVKNKSYGKNPLHPTGPDLLGDVVFGNNLQSVIKFKYTVLFINNDPNNKKGRMVLKDDPTKIIVDHYDEYRDEQAKFIAMTGGLPHYSDMWHSKDIYN